MKDPSFWQNLAILLPGVVQVRRSSNRSTAKSEIEMRFNWYEVGKIAVGYGIAAFIGVVTTFTKLNSDMETMQRLIDAQMQVINAQLTTISTQQQSLQTTITSISIEQARRSEAINWAFQEMRKGGNERQRSRD